MAEVSLVLERTGTGPLWDQVSDDDQSSDLQRQLAGVSEITVTRRYFRSGESEYLINRTSCRLRDITELFLGSGVGTRAYALIEQGRVEQLVNAKPEALRLFIEEAAGTTRYRSRRIVAERKMERTRGHLIRLSDIIREIERQINSLTRQAKRAEEYRQYRRELQEIELHVARRRYSKLSEEIHAAACRLEALSEEETGIAAELRDAEQAAADAQTAVREADQRQRDAQVRIVQLRLEAQAATERLGHIDETIAGLWRRGEEMGSERQELQLELGRANDERAQAEDTLQCLRAEACEAAIRRQVLEQDLRNHTTDVARGETLVEELKSEAVHALAEELRFQNLVGGLGRHRDELGGRLERAGQAKQRLAESAETCRVDVEATRRRMSTLQVEADQAEATCREQAAAVDAARRVEGAAARDAEDAREHVAGLSSRLRSIEELNARWDGCARGVRHVVERLPESVLGVVADVLQVPEAYEAAVAAALGPRLQCLIVQSHEESVRALRVLEGASGGRASFIPVSPRVSPENESGEGVSLFDVVETPENYRALARSLLGNVRVVETLTDAVALWNRNGTAAVTVTKAGELIDGLGVLSGGSERPLEEALLARNREIRELRLEMTTATARASDAAECQRTAVQRVNELGRVHEEAVSRLQGLRVDCARARKDEERLEEGRQRLAVECEAAEGDMLALQQECGEAVAELEMLTVQFSEARLYRTRQEAALHECQASVTQAREKVEQTREALAGLSVEEAHRGEQQSRSEEIARRAAERARQIRGRWDELGERVAELEKETAWLSAERSRVEERRATMLADLATSESNAADEADRAAAAGSEATRCEDAARELREALERCREDRRRLDVDLAERRATLDHVVQGIKEKYGEDVTRTDLAEVGMAGLPEGEEIDQRIEELRACLARLGDVHVGAIDELEELRTRHDYLRGQREDLQRSVDDLRRTIAKLNRLSRTRFRETFDEANRKLGEIFPRLFPGGRAQLVLSEVDDETESGVEIVVQPVGKKLESLSLLSGGEKALTAVALILSLYMIRPAPFCVLDEVDAPLDDANVGRFDQLIREISRSSQFVLITHNKRTMEAADTLYGITMEEAGVSKVVSVRFKQAA